MKPTFQDRTPEEVITSPHDRTGYTDLSLTREAQPATEEESDSGHHRAYTLKELLEMDFPEPEWVVEGIMPQGLHVLGGRPKVGKSLLSLDLAACVAQGIPFMGREVTQGVVLYLALEDPLRSVQARIQRQHPSIYSNSPLIIRDGLKAKPQDVLAVIRSEIDVQRPRLMVIDTFTALLPGVDQNKGGVMAPIWSGLHSITKDTGCSILVIDHHRKPAADAQDVVNDVSGATAKASSVDTIYGLYKAEEKSTGTFAMRGREVEDQEISVTLDSSSMTWQPHSSHDFSSGQFAQIQDALRGLGTANNKQLAEAMEINKGSLSRHLRVLESKGVVREHDGEFSLV